MQLDPRHLAQLSVIVSTGSFTEAAALLDLAQSALSRNIRTLERCVGAPVLRRTRRRAVPTEIGLALARQGEVIHAAHRAAADVAASVGSVRPTRLRIATTSLMSEFFLIEPLSTFVSARADMTCHLRIGTIEELMRMVAFGEADVAIGHFGTLPDRDALHLDHLIDDCLTIVASPRHPLAGRHVSAARIAAESRWVLPEAGGTLRWEIETALRYSGVSTIDIACETGTTGPIAGLVRASGYVAMLPRFALSPLIASGDLVELFVDETLPRRPIGIVTQSDRRKSAVIASFIRALRQAAGRTGRPPATAAR